MLRRITGSLKVRRSLLGTEASPSASHTPYTPFRSTMDPVVEISSGSVYELDPVLSRTKSSTIHTTSSLDDSFGGSYVSSDGSDFPVHEVLGR